jgi:hypothetical protein
MEIKLGTGIGEITFGKKEAEIIAILGEPDKMFTSEDEEEELIYQYNKQKLRLTFYNEEEGRLGYISCGNPALTFEGKHLIGEPVTKVTDEVLKDLNEWNVENYDYFDTYLNEEKWIVLTVDYDVVMEVDFGVILDEDEEYIWP